MFTNAILCLFQFYVKPRTTEAVIKSRSLRIYKYPVTVSHWGTYVHDNAGITLHNLTIFSPAK